MVIDAENIRKNILEVVENYLDEEYTVIGILRFGAHIPHIYKNACDQYGKKARTINLLLSHMVTFFPLEFYNDKKFLLLDDTVYRGTGLRTLKNKLLEIGIQKENIQTATLIVHADSKYVPDFPKQSLRLPDAEYIAWKEVLGSIVTGDIRPTDRDHPLYFFGARNIETGKFLEILKDYGELHSVGIWNPEVLKFSLTIDTAILKKNIVLDGVDTGSVCKVRFYWSQKSDQEILAIVPMVFPTVDIDKFIKSGSSRILARKLGLRESFYEELQACNEIYTNQMLYYFIGRSIAALLLEILLSHISPRVQTPDSRLVLYDPKEVDRPVNYIFPPVYEEFYEIVSKRITKLLEYTSETRSIPLFEHWEKLPKNGSIVQKDPLIPSYFNILEYIVNINDPAIWNGESWEPNPVEKGVSFHELLSEFKDAVFVSKSLDELLESGLLRARDEKIEIPNGCYSRIFLPGGEYNAVAVSRIADTLKFQASSNIDPQIAEEDAIELWGPF